MIRKRKILIILMVLLFLGISVSAIYSQSKMWVTAYYAGWMQGQNNDGYLTTSNIDFSAVTQIIHFSVVPNSDGSIDYSSNSITAANSAALVSGAHAAGVKAIICVGGWNSESGFLGATSLLNLSTFVSNIVNFMKTRGYDGIDIDWETLNLTDAVQYTAFITALRSALDKISPRPLLTAATQWQPAIFSALSGKFDEINIMSYDMSGAWPGWVSWYNSPVFDAGVKFASTGALVPSINDMTSTFSTTGIPAGKLGIGIDFYGYVWSGGDGTPTGGVTAPNQSWTTAPSVQANVPYSTIMQQYYQPGYYRWDANAQSSYLSIDNPGSANDKFISYDDENSCTSKVNYVKSHGLGGVIIWELGGGYRNNMPAGQQDLLLQSIKKAVNGSGTVVTAKDTIPPVVNIIAPTNGSTATGSVNISANATDNVGITGVVFKVDGGQIGSLITKPPYSVSWNSSADSNGTHTITVTAFDSAGNANTTSINIDSKNTVASVSSGDQSVPKEFKLEQNYPNPFNPSTTIEFSLPASSFVTLEIYNILGQKVASLINGNMDPGNHTVVWNASNLASGVYIYLLHAGNATLQRKMELLK